MRRAPQQVRLIEDHAHLQDLVQLAVDLDEPDDIRSRHLAYSGGEEER